MCGIILTETLLLSNYTKIKIVKKQIEKRRQNVIHEVIALFNNPVVKSLQRYQSNGSYEHSNRLAFLYANVLESTQSCNG